MLKGSKRNMCVKKKHEMTKENTWIKPSNGKRHCKACQRMNRRINRVLGNIAEEEHSRAVGSIESDPSCPIQQVMDSVVLGMPKVEHAAGYKAFKDGKPLDSKASFDWMDGWIQAKDEKTYADIQVEGKDESQDKQ